MTNLSELRPVSERITLLDVLRGIALLGILIFNIGSMSGATFVAMVLPPHAADTFLWNRFDAITDSLIVALIEGKFYSLFSLLFGVGFAVILSRCEARGVDPSPYLRRRYLGLLVIGLIHTILAWLGLNHIDHGGRGIAPLPNEHRI